MADIEANANSDVKIKKKSKVNLILRSIFHGCCFVVFVFVMSWGFKIWYTMEDDETTDPILKDLKVLTPFFFTNWNFMFQTIFLALSLAHDVLEWLDKQDGSLASKIKYWRDVIFSGMMVPFTLFVTSMFWCVYAIDRELVFPKIYDTVVPWWFNHCVHTNITIVVIIETLLQARRKPTNPRLELIFYWTIAFAYAIVYYAIYFITGRWLYQVFGIMNWWQVCLYQLGIWLVTYIFYIIQFPINRLIHGPEENETNTDSEQKGITEDKIYDENERKEIENNETAKDKTPFSKEAWSLKFRSIKNHFENSRL